MIQIFDTVYELRITSNMSSNEWSGGETRLLSKVHALTFFSAFLKPPQNAQSFICDNHNFNFTVCTCSLC
jgi:hypothetical protein